MFRLSVPFLLFQRSCAFMNKAPRLHGTITAFKHRNGFGFLIADGKAKMPNSSTDASSPTVEGKSQGTSPTASAHSSKQYFFVRSSLHGGGFYITEGERVSFTPQAATTGKDIHQKLGKRRGGNDDGLGESAGTLEAAVDIRLYDPRTGEEYPVVPVMLRGLITAWDITTGTGTVAELDLAGNYNPDSAPRYHLTADNMDLPSNGISLVTTGAKVRFCVEPTTPAGKFIPAAEDGDADEASQEGGQQQLPLARRIVLDNLAKLKAQKASSDNSRSRSSRAGSQFGGSGDDEAASGHGRRRAPTNSGTVRELVGRFGFIAGDVTGESIFFHADNVRGKIQEGDRVQYRVESITYGRHKGKMSCVDVALAKGESAKKSTDDEDEALDDVFDVLL